MRRVAVVFGLLLFVAACTDSTADLDTPVEPLGDFGLDFVGVVAPNLEKLLISRDATEEEWIALVDAALKRRFGRFDGTAEYHLGVSVEAYSLPPPIVPGKSALAIRVTVWDKASMTKLNPETEVISVIKVFESRIASSREESMQALADDAALQTERWLRRMQAEKGWFGGAESAN